MFLNEVIVILLISWVFVKCVQLLCLNCWAVFLYSKTLCYMQHVTNNHAYSVLSCLNELILVFVMVIYSKIIFIKYKNSSLFNSELKSAPRRVVQWDGRDGASFYAEQSYLPGVIYNTKSSLTPNCLFILSRDVFVIVAWPPVPCLCGWIDAGWHRPGHKDGLLV